MNLNGSLNYNHEENLRQLWNFSHHKSFAVASLTKTTEENALWAHCEPDIKILLLLFCVAIYIS